MNCDWLVDPNDPRKKTCRRPGCTNRLVTDHPPERCFARCEATVVLVVNIPADLPEGFETLAGEHELDFMELRPGQFRRYLPGSPVEYIELQNTTAGVVLAFGSGSSWNCRPGIWGRAKGLDVAELLAGEVTLPAREPGRAAAVVKLAPKVEACSTSYG